MLSFVRFFWLPPLRNTAASFVCPATLAPLLFAGAAPDERQRLQGQPLSWLLARSGLSCRPPYPQAVLVPRNLLAGVAAPLLFCAPACASARRFPLWCAKAHLVSPPHRCHLSPQWPYWCLPLRGRRRKRHARRRFTSPRDGHTGACLFGVAAAKGTPAAASD